MQIHWLYLALAILVLLPPIPLSAEVRKNMRRRSVPDLWAAARLWQNWVDLARAALGAYLLESAVDASAPNDPQGEFFALALKAAVLGAVLLAQTVRNVNKTHLLAPVFYLCGVTLILGGVGGTWAGAFAVGVGWLFAVGGQNLSYQLPAMAVAAAVAAYVLGPMRTLVLNSALILTPLLLSVLFRKRLVFASSLSPE